MPTLKLLAELPYRFFLLKAVQMHETALYFEGLPGMEYRADLARSLSVFFEQLSEAFPHTARAEND